MVEQLFTATGEEKGNGQERRKQLFTAGREKRTVGFKGEVFYCGETRGVIPAKAGIQAEKR
jgi:hypothetical protein